MWAVTDASTVFLPEDFSKYGVSIINACRPFNFGTLALLSLPFYLGLSIQDGRFIGIDEERLYSRPMYNLTAPEPYLGGSIEEWATSAKSYSIDSFYTFYNAWCDRVWIRQNVQIPIMLYGLSHALAALGQACREWEDVRSFSDYIKEPYLVDLMNYLVSAKAIPDPFSTFGTFHATPHGAENAMDLNADLAQTLELVELISPFPITTYGAPYKLKVFYALIDYFNLKPVFGISRWKKIVI